MAGTVTSLIANIYAGEWIIDSGDTHHIISSFSMLKNITKLNSFSVQQVHLPNREKSNITHIGTTEFLQNIRVNNVLYLPDFKYNLNSVSKLTKYLSCFVTSFLIFVYFKIYIG